MRVRLHTLNEKIRRFQKDSGLVFVKATTINESGWVYRLLEEDGYKKKYTQKDVSAYINKYDLKLSYVNFHSNVKVLQKKYADEHEDEDIKDSGNEKQDNNVDLTDEVFLEGNKKLRKHMCRERKAKVIKLAKEKYKNQYGILKCEICDFDFKSMYGYTGEDFIEGHHLKPVSELVEGEQTKIEDIVLVCSNCHSMLHRRKVWLNKENLKLLLEDRI
ncbi:HNH endonuclease [Clostridium gasigenes]|nr:HNH endonuclease [Clostridium gasigenes]